MDFGFVLFVKMALNFNREKHFSVTGILYLMEMVDNLTFMFQYTPLMGGM